MVTYNFHNLAALADHFASLAAERRRDAEWIEKRKMRGYKARALIARAEAAAYHNAVSILRNTRIEEKPR